jgi:PAS domain S-box-containing protein
MSTARRILIIDDNSFDRELVRRELTREFPEIEVDEVFQPDAFSEYLERGGFDLVITDYSIKWINGLEVLRAVKSKYRQCPVIMFTGTGNEEIAVSAMKNGLDDYVVKSSKHYFRLMTSVHKSLERAENLRRTEEALIETEKRFQLVVESVKDFAIFGIDLKGRVISWNAGIKRILGYDEDEIVGQPVSIIFTPKDRENLVPELELDQAIKTGEASDNRWHMRKDGTLFYASGTVTPIRNSAGVVTGLAKVMRDITETKRTHEELQKWGQIFEHAGWGVVIENARNNTFELMNPAFARMHGYEVHELVGQPIEKLFAEEEHGKLRESLRAVEVLGHLSFESIHLRKDGTRFPVHIDKTAIRSSEGDLIYRAANVQDVTERKDLEMALKARAEELERVNRIKDEFLATLSHELRTPLTSILGWAHMLGSVVGAAVDALRPAANAKNIELKIDMEQRARAMFGDADRLQQVIWNLLSNAIKFTPERGHVSLSLQDNGTHARLIVSDTGKGIEPGFLPFVFDRFRQADSSTTRAYGGLGLGLSIVRHLVELHGGSVRAESDGEGKGSRFTLDLPYTVPQLRDEQRIPELPESKISTEVEKLYLEGLKVLIVDDDDEAISLLRLVLEGAGASVVSASSVADAMKLFNDNKPDVLVSDLAMPGEDGYTLIKKIRTLPAERGGRTPAAALTAYVRTEDRIRVLASGFQTHITKPVEPTEVITVVATLAGRTMD